MILRNKHKIIISAGRKTINTMWNFECPNFISMPFYIFTKFGRKNPYIGWYYCPSCGEELKGKKEKKESSYERMARS